MRFNWKAFEATECSDDEMRLGSGRMELTPEDGQLMLTVQCALAGQIVDSLLLATAWGPWRLVRRRTFWLLSGCTGELCDARVELGGSTIRIACTN